MGSHDKTFVSVYIFKNFYKVRLKKKILKKTKAAEWLCYIFPRTCPRYYIPLQARIHIKKH
jgi:hypothetical protein